MFQEVLVSKEKQIAAVEAAKVEVDRLKGELEEAQKEFREGLLKLLGDHGKGPHVIAGKAQLIAVRKSQSNPAGTPVLMPDRPKGASGARKKKASAEASGDASTSDAAPKKKRTSKKSNGAAAASV